KERGEPLFAPRQIASDTVEARGWKAVRSGEVRLPVSGLLERADHAEQPELVTVLLVHAHSEPDIGGASPARSHTHATTDPVAAVRPPPKGDDEPARPQRPPGGGERGRGGPNRWGAPPPAPRGAA